MQARYLIIVNPTANDGKTEQIWPLIKSMLDGNNVDYRVRQTEYHNHARLITEQFTKEFSTTTDKPNILLVIGGDGTLNQVVTGAKNTIRNNPNANLREFPVAVIPTGKNNNFALAAGISSDWSKALPHVLGASQPRKVTIGYYYNNFNHRYHYFLNNMGIGFESNLLSSQHHSKWRWFATRFHKLKRLWDILINLYSIKEFPLYYSSGLRTMSLNRVVWIAIYNTPYFDNHRALMPGASLNKNSLNIMVLENKNILLVTWAVFLMFIGKVPHGKFIKHFDVQRFKISIPSIEYGNIDNEELGGHFYNTVFGTTNFNLI